MSEFLGSKWVWWVGVVEDRADPLKAGRVRVRILGTHTDNKTTLPTNRLPWSQCMLPVTSSGINGIGWSNHSLVEGSWVMGYFRDGERNEAVIMGSLPGKPSELAEPSKGFYDPNGIYPKYKNEPDVNRLAVNDAANPHLALTIREAARVLNVPNADFNTTTAADGSLIAASDNTTWDQPAIPYAAVYPYNNVYESESGHLLEFDDTPPTNPNTDDEIRHERIHLRHRTGSSLEFHPNGTVVELTKGDKFTITDDNSYSSITGNSDISIDGHHKLYINKSGQLNNHYDIQIGANANINIQVDDGDINVVTVKGKVNVNSAGDYNLKVGGNMNVTVAGSVSETVEGQHTSNTTGSRTIRANQIDLNP